MQVSNVYLVINLCCHSKKSHTHTHDKTLAVKLCCHATALIILAGNKGMHEILYKFEIGQIRSRTAELADLECLKKIPIDL